MPTADDMVKALELHYRGGPGHRDADSYATYAELTHPNQRRIDFMAVSLWASRGLAIDGHEIKVSRADWLNELAHPTKADTWWNVCHRWWLVVPDAALVHDGELPDGWGLMVPGTGRRMKVVTKPAVRQLVPPMWLTATMLKRDQRAIANARDRGREEGRRAGEASERERADRRALTMEQSRRLQAVDDLEKLLGRRLEPHAWNDEQVTPERAAFALRIATALDGLSPRHGRGIADLLRLAKQIGDSAAELENAHIEVTAHLEGVGRG